MNCFRLGRGLHSILLVYDKNRKAKRKGKKERKKTLKIYSRWISNLKPCSIPDSGIRVCSARHDRNLPWSSNVGWNVKIDLVKFPSDEVCVHKKKSDRNYHIVSFMTSLLTHSLVVLSWELPFHQEINGAGREPVTSHFKSYEWFADKYFTSWSNLIVNGRTNFHPWKNRVRRKSWKETEIRKKMPKSEKKSFNGNN